MIQRQIAKLLTYDERNKCSDAQKNIIAQCMSSAFWGVSARKIAKNICPYQLKMLRQSGKKYEERRREGKDFNKLEEDRMNEQIKNNNWIRLSCDRKDYSDPEAVMYRSNRRFNILLPGHTPGIWRLCHPWEKGIWLWESSRGWGIWTLASISCGISGRFARGELSWRTRCQSLFVEKIVPLWPIGYEERA